jgi:hypothetical protein
MRYLFFLLFVFLITTGNAQNKSIKAADLPGIWKMIGIHQKKGKSNPISPSIPKYFIFGSWGSYCSSTTIPDTTPVKTIVNRIGADLKLTTDTILIPACFKTNVEPAAPDNFQKPLPDSWSLRRKKLSLHYIVIAGMTTNPQVPLKTYYKTETTIMKIISLNKTEMVIKYKEVNYIFQRIGNEPGDRKDQIIKTSK